jgi:hypothetical protein
MLIRFCIYGLLGWCFEVAFTAVTEKAWGRQQDWRLVGHSYLWMFPIYGLLAPLGEPIHNFMRPHFWLLRGIVYTLGIWLVEYQRHGGARIRPCMVHVRPRFRKSPRRAGEAHTGHHPGFDPLGCRSHEPR